jgi:hypothetical protein
MISKKYLIPMAAIAAIGVTAITAVTVSAASDTTNPQASLVQKIADKFGLDKTKVQAVFDQDKQDRQAGHEANYEKSLTQAVTDGKLTSAQKDLILAEHKKLLSEMQTAMENADNSANKTDRRAAMEKIRTEATDWAKANNVDAKWLRIGPGAHGHGMGPGMMGRGHGMGPQNDNDGGPTPSATPSATPDAS